MSYTQYFHFRKEELKEEEFNEICDFVAEVAVDWYHDGSHGDAYVSDIKKKQKGGKFFSSEDYSGLSSLWKEQK